MIENIRFTVSLDDIRNWKRKVYDIKFQTIICIIYSVFAGVYTIALLAFQNGGFVGFGPLSFYVLNSFLTGTILYALLIDGLFYARLGKYEFNLFSLDPSGSEIILRLSRLQNGFVFVLAILIALNNLVFAYFKLLTIIQVVATWLPLALCFTLNQLALGKIISNAKLQTLTSVQVQIEKLFKKEEILSKETLEQINKLMDLYNNIKNTNNFPLTWQTFLGFINSSLLPFIGFLIGNLDLIIKTLP